MNNWKATAATLLLAGALAVPGITLAQDDCDFPPMYGGQHKHQGDHFGRMAQMLDLSEEQRSQLSANRETVRTARMEQRKQMRELRKQLYEAVQSGADQAKLDSLGVQLGKLEVEKIQQMQQMRQKMESILTDEQKAKFEQLKSERKERRKERGECWMMEE